ncbi:hypothetical protein P171DRAFT_432900 [Karstenula rhodostoma CBS 690.94]|uniref:Uncharacterized protein n=1 Tax=Karstenula rhodostoma CBS 690.94 TaxID=1392251 RepID=A0A9P4PI18_9PLEO|nr:hypothetical protein P171DRAFT_432900 [Karstenula rhodostoma CBS 690.94]
MRFQALLWLSIATATATATALPVLALRQLSSYGRYHSYGHYDGSYGEYPSPPLEAEMERVKGADETNSQEGV